MFYKEWLNIRPKLVIWALAYGLVVWSFKSLPLASYMADVASGEFMYTGAQTISFYLTLILPILGGADLIAGESERGTLGFLLSRPISRRNIYLGKLAINWLGWASIYTVSSLIIALMLGTSFVSLLSIPAIVLVGTAIMCLSAPVSIFTTSTIHAIMLTTGVMIATAFILISSFSIFYIEMSDIELLLASVVGTGTVSVGLLTVGQMIFARKEF